MILNVDYSMNMEFQKKTHGGYIYLLIVWIQPEGLSNIILIKVCAEVMVEEMMNPYLSIAI